MDAPDDRDIKLQRASAELLKEFKEKLPPLLWKQTTVGTSKRIVHRWSQPQKEARLIDILERFQEWPQLLDPHLQNFLPQLVDAYLAYLIHHRHLYGSKEGKAPSSTRIVPLPRSICRILYTFCKVRGFKVISRFLNNEPKFLDLMLRAFISWDSIVPGDPQAVSVTGITVVPLIWEERYIMLLWLSHLLLAPFDLTSLSSDDIEIPYQDLAIFKSIPPKVPKIAHTILSIATRYVVAAGKEREAATILLARLALRLDMQQLGLLQTLMDWALSVLQPCPENDTPPPAYTCIGVLSFLARLGTSGQAEDLESIIGDLFDKILHIAQAESTFYTNIRSSASARKMIIKILRASATVALILTERGSQKISEDKVSSILEESIDYFLVALADKDMPIRFAASKALAVVTLKLDPAMGADVVDAVTGSLEENILYEKKDGTLITPLEAQRLDLSTLKRNLSAVDPQRWQGLLLTLAHLLFRQAPPLRQMPDILQALISGLDFEQRSTTGTSVGTGVRDAACFGLWAVSRKYTTKELLSLDTSSVKAPTEQKGGDILQILAMELVCAACVDPSGNIRRGASAALQELIGRHPNTIVEGIPLVQVVDYHAVARRSRAMIEVAKGAALLDSNYWRPLVNSLLFWRGIGSSDPESRRTAASALGKLSSQNSFSSLNIVLQNLQLRLSSIAPKDIESRHGCLLALAATIDAFILEFENNPQHEDAPAAKKEISKLWEIFDSSHGPTKDDLTQQSLRPELTAEASSHLIASLARASGTVLQTEPVPEVLITKALDVLLLCVFRGEDTAIEASSEAASQLFRIVPLWKQEETIQGWFANIHASWKSATGRGQISALGAVFHRLPVDSEIRQFIVKELILCTRDEEFIGKRVSAVKCFSNGVLPHIDITDDIVDLYIGFLTDYTTDRRGDIGSFIRIEAIQAVQSIFERELDASQQGHTELLLRCLCRLAAEKLDKVRFQAWTCLQHYWEHATDLPSLESKFEHFSQISSVQYFHQLLKLLHLKTLRPGLIQGLVTSASAGLEGLIQSSRFALLDFIESQSESKPAWVDTVIKELVVILEANLSDDRYAIPAMEIASFVLDTYVPALGLELKDTSLRKLFILVQKAHFKSSNIPRLETAVKVYSALSRIPTLQAEVLKKMTSMLLHPYPKVRIAVSDSLYTETKSDLIKDEDWTAAPKQFKVTVERLRGELKVN